MRTYNVFISHSWSYGDAYDKLSKMLVDGNYFLHKDYSVPKNDPIHNATYDYQLEEAITNQIRPCSVVIIMTGMYSHYSKWINKEVAIARRLGKPILAIEPWGSERTSVFVKNSADKIVGWNGPSIIKAIKEISI